MQPAAPPTHGAWVRKTEPTEPKGRLAVDTPAARVAGTPGVPASESPTVRTLTVVVSPVSPLEAIASCSPDWATEYAAVIEPVPSAALVPVGGAGLRLPPTALGALNVTGTPAVVATLSNASYIVKPRANGCPAAGLGRAGACEVSATEVILSRVGGPLCTVKVLEVPSRIPEWIWTLCDWAFVKYPLKVNVPVGAAATARVAVVPPVTAVPWMVASESAPDRVAVTDPPLNGTIALATLSAFTTMSLGVPAMTGGATATSKWVAEPSSTWMLGVGPETVKMPPPIPRSGNSSVPGAAGALNEIVAVTVPPGSTV